MKCEQEVIARALSFFRVLSRSCNAIFSLILFRLFLLIIPHFFRLFLKLFSYVLFLDFYFNLFLFSAFERHKILRNIILWLKIFVFFINVYNN